MSRYFSAFAEDHGLLPATHTADMPVDECEHACYATAQCRPKLRRIKKPRVYPWGSTWVGKRDKSMALCDERVTP